MFFFKVKCTFLSRIFRCLSQIIFRVHIMTTDGHQSSVPDLFPRQTNGHLVHSVRSTEMTLWNISLAVKWTFISIPSFPVLCNSNCELLLAFCGSKITSYTKVFCLLLSNTSPYWASPLEYSSSLSFSWHSCVSLTMWKYSLATQSVVREQQQHQHHV